MEPEKQKRLDTNTESVAKQSTRRTEAGAGKPARRPDARRDSGQLKRNQERLGVGPEHKTAAMKRGRRGTFP
jgi:hypothetical protein